MKITGIKHSKNGRSSSKGVSILFDLEKGMSVVTNNSTKKDIVVELKSFVDADGSFDITAYTKDVTGKIGDCGVSKTYRNVYRKTKKVLNKLVA